MRERTRIATKPADYRKAVRELPRPGKRETVERITYIEKARKVRPVFNPSKKD